MADFIRIALIGAGKIARDLHIPTIAKHPRFECACIISPHSRVEGYPNYSTLADALDGGEIFDAVAVCTPPQVRVAIALDCIRNGFDVMLEKPPAESPEAAINIRDAANSAGIVAFATWHSRFAAKVSKARDWLQGRTLAGGSITWREDVFKWHPGQNWLWDEGGLGVFDPGINPLSILTALVDSSFTVESARFDTPENAATPAVASFTLRSDKIVVPVDLSFLEQDGDIWQLRIEDTAGETFALEHGGSDDPDGGILDGEYYGLYDHFAKLVDTRQSDFDIRPLQIVADAFAIAQVTRVAAIKV